MELFKSVMGAGERAVEQVWMEMPKPPLPRPLFAATELGERELLAGSRSQRSSRKAPSGPGLDQALLGQLGGGRRSGLPCFVSAVLAGA